MPEEQIDEQQEAPILDEVATDQEPEDVASSYSDEEIEGFRQKAAKADEYKGYAARVAAENKRLKRAHASETTESQLTNEQSVPDSEERFERLELKTEGYSTEEIEQIMDLGGKAALQNKILQDAIALQRRRAKSKEATPSGTGKSPILQQFSERDLKNMSLSDLEKIVPQD